jgi:hypothetical protein
MLAEGFEPTVPASERTQTYALDRTATGIGSRHNYTPKVFATSAFETYICVFATMKVKLISLAPVGVTVLFGSLALSFDCRCYMRTYALTSWSAKFNLTQANSHIWANEGKFPPVQTVAGNEVLTSA